ncbi:hypothetical protein EVAR_33422_1 [Eumeta japonica]|uniref:Uncharacterized protein n=1 Tax=Eumeta variegata TaxID=151549 RepID=A0A4C1W493_EUMVA|nr:hypothetical protein EVAR_33422_1 [Eumeta japonica]
MIIIVVWSTSANFSQGTKRFECGRRRRPRAEGRGRRRRRAVTKLSELVNNAISAAVSTPASGHRRRPVKTDKFISVASTKITWPKAAAGARARAAAAALPPRYATAQEKDVRPAAPCRRFPRGTRQNKY